MANGGASHLELAASSYVSAEWFLVPVALAHRYELPGWALAAECLVTLALMALLQESLHADRRGDGPVRLTGKTRWGRGREWVVAIAPGMTASVESGALALWQEHELVLCVRGLSRRKMALVRDYFERQCATPGSPAQAAAQAVPLIIPAGPLPRTLLAAMALFLSAWLARDGWLGIAAALGATLSAGQFGFEVFWRLAPLRSPGVRRALERGPAAG